MSACGLGEADFSRLKQESNTEGLRFSTVYCNGTALLDAIGISVETLGRRLAAMQESVRPDKVLVAIMTDGQENSSREYSRDRIRQMIEHQNSKYNWQFVFLAADINGVNDAQSIGIKRDRITNYQSTQHVKGAIKELSDTAARYRSSGRI